MEISNTIYFPKTTSLKEKISQLGAKAAKDHYQVNDLVAHLNKVFLKEYQEYINRGEYFPGCPFDLYEQHYESRLQEYLKTYPDADEFDFLKEEDSLFWSLSRMDVESKDNFYSFYPHLYLKPHRLNIDLSINKMHYFIDMRIEELGHYFYAPGFEDTFDIPVNLPRHYWEPARNLNAEGVSLSRGSNISRGKDPKGITLKSLFQEENLFSYVVDKLKEHNLLDSSKDGKWKLSSVALASGSSLTEERAMAAFGFVLYDRNYFQGGTKPVHIARGLNDFFSTELKEKTYNRSHKEFLKMKQGPEIRNAKCYEYTGIFHMIRHQQPLYINSKPM